MRKRTAFRLQVKQRHEFCDFELSWGKGLGIPATLSYPELLISKYEEWRNAYLNSYRNLQRGRLINSTSINLPADYLHTRLVKAEVAMLSEFHKWLRNADLFEMRTEIASATKALSEQEYIGVDVFVSCNSPTLMRLPWEVWEIGEGALEEAIRIVRTSSHIRHELAQHRKGKARILVIVGYDEKIDFQEDKQDVRRVLNGVAEVEFVGWQPGQDQVNLKTDICDAITNQKGWDVLFFAGHSNESPLMGGELGIAPGVSLSIHEIEKPLIQAKKHGLQFAIFNSCSGLDIAESLIKIGLSQVAVMREPIHNQVAREFLVRFLEVLAEYRDVHDAVRSACQHLKLEKYCTYPSGYLIPSVFCHPDAVLFQLKPSGFKQWIQKWLPTQKEALALGTVLLLSLLPPVQDGLSYIQDYLLDRRTWTQAVYRNLTDQMPSATPPPVLLVQIDQESITQGKIDQRKINPIDRTYLATLINQLSALKASVIGLDYVLDSPTLEDRVLAESVHKSIADQGTWFVFAAIKKEVPGELGVTANIVNPNSSLQGYIDAWPQYVELLPANADCTRVCPFAYLLALVRTINQSPLSPNLRQARLQNPRNLRASVIAYLKQGNSQNHRLAYLKQAHLPAITSFSEKFSQLWLQPIIDFSIPPKQVYDPIPAWKLQGLDESARLRLKQQVAIIAPGGYEGAGITLNEDNLQIPLAVAYWRKQGKRGDYSQAFTGGEVHAYAIHHLLTQRLVVPIPDLWMIGVAVLLGKGTTQVLLEQQRQQRRWMIGLLATATAGYGLAGLQIYISGAVLLPWFLPSAVFWMYILLAFRR
jgi:hypothetical protein